MESRDRYPTEAHMLRLYPPRPSQDAICRTELIDLILEVHAEPVVIIQAPAGYGKSTLMQQVQTASSARGILTGWLTLDESNNDVTRLYDDLQLVLNGILSDKADSVTIENQEHGVYGKVSAHDRLLDQLVKIGKPITLFVDEFQHIVNRDVLKFFHDLLGKLPDWIRVVIGSRTIPDLRLTRHLLMERVLFLGIDRLNFSRDELASFLLEAELDLTDAEMDAIYEKTEGWPAAIRLYRLSLEKSDIRRSLARFRGIEQGQLAEYLSENVLSLLPKETQKFLTETSLLTRMSAALCDHVTGRSDSADMLKALEWSGVFVRSLDPGRTWFQYHSLFAEVLTAQLRRQAPDRIQEIHSQAADWFRTHALHEQAIHHALAVGNGRLAASILETWSSQLVMSGKLATILSWYKQIPLNVIKDHPRLVVRVAWAVAFQPQRRDQAELLGVLDEIKARNGEATAVGQDVVRSMICFLRDDIAGAIAYSDRVNVHKRGLDDFASFELGATSLLRGQIALNKREFDSARTYLLLGSTHGKRANAVFTVIAASAASAVKLIMQGHLQEALQCLKDVSAADSVSLDRSIALGSFAAVQIRALYEVNDLESALTLFEQAHDVIVGGAQLDFLALGFLAVVRLHDAADDRGRATSLLEEAESIGLYHSWPRLVRLIDLERVRRALTYGEINKAASLASRIFADDAFLPDKWIPSFEDTEDLQTCSARLALHEQRFADALSVIASEERHAKRQGRVHRTIKLMVLRTLAYELRGDHGDALNSLQSALKLAAPGGYVRTFLDEGPAIMPVLARACDTLMTMARHEGKVRSGDRSDRFLEVLLSASAPQANRRHTAAAPDAGRREELSEREQQILGLLASGMSNKDIAESVCVSENTVKFHLKNVYSKLGVKSRVQAINLARGMGMNV